MAKRKPEFIGPTQPVWLRCKFPVLDIKQFPGAKRTLQKPFCWTPAKPWGKLLWGYPCISFETTNFGWIIQRGPDGMIWNKY